MKQIKQSSVTHEHWMCYFNQILGLCWIVLIEMSSLAFANR